MLKYIHLAFFFATIFHGLIAQTPFTAVYSFGSTNDVSSFTYNGAPIPGVTMGAMLKVGITSSSSNNNFRGSNWPLTTNPDLGKYIGFSMAPVAGYTFTVTSITFGIGRSGTGTRKTQWRGNDDSYASILNNYSSINAGLTNTAGVLENPDVNSSWTGNILNLGTEYNGLSNSAEFRMFMYEAEATTGTAGLQGNITISGTYTLSSNTPVSLKITNSLPSSIEIGQSFDVTVCAVDENENIVASYMDDITLSQTFGTAANIAPSTIITPVNGCVTFNITPTIVNETISFTASSGILNNALTDNINVVPACSPINVISPSATNGNQSSVINWTNPVCYDEIMVVATTAAGITFAPAGDGSAYTANPVYSGPDQVVFKGTGTIVNVTGLTNGSTYYFEIFTRKGTVWSSGIEVSATPFALTCPDPGDLVITEVMIDPADPVSDGTGEYFEIYNKSSNAIDLAGWKVRDLGTQSFIISGSQVVAPGQFFVFKINNGIVTPFNYIYPSSFQISNTADEIILECPHSTPLPTIITQLVYNADKIVEGVALELFCTESAPVNSNQTHFVYTDQSDTPIYSGSNYGSPGSAGRTITTISTPTQFKVDSESDAIYYGLTTNVEVCATDASNNVVCGFNDAITLVHNSGPSVTITPVNSGIPINSCALFAVTVNDPSTLCGDVEFTASASGITNPFSFILPAKKIYSSENFNNCGTIVPAWTAQSVVGAQVWSCNISDYRMNGFATINNENEDWLVSPNVSLANDDNIQIDFIGNKRFAGNNLQLYYSTDYSGSVITSTWNELPITFEPLRDNFIWKNSGLKSLPESVMTGDVRFGIKYTSTTASSAEWRVDNIRISSCVKQCDISNAQISNISICNPLDGTFTADISVTFLNPPSTGTLDILGDASSSISVGSLVGNTHQFTAIEFTADGNLKNILLSFSDNSLCSYNYNNIEGTDIPSCNTATPVPGRMMVNEVFADESFSGSCGQNGFFYEFIATAPLTNPTATLLNLSKLEIDPDANDVNGLTGYLRFKANNTTFGSIPVGSMIVIYNPDNNPFGLTLTIDPIAKKYIIPVNHASLECRESSSGLWAGTETMTLCDILLVYNTYVGVTGQFVQVNEIDPSGLDGELEIRTGTAFHTFPYVGLNATTSSSFTCSYMRNNAAIQNLAPTPGASNNSVNNDLRLSIRASTIDYNGFYGNSFNCLLLPVNLISFNGKSVGNTNLLYWTAELNDHFEKFIIEKSSDGLNFKELKQVTPVNFQLKSFSLTDENPDKNNYYRLLMKDKDGSINVSDVIRLSNIQSSDYKVYPNPTSNYLNITSENNLEKATGWEVKNVNSKVVISGKKLTDKLKIDVSELQGGVYFISIIEKNTSTNIKFIKVD